MAPKKPKLKKAQPTVRRSSIRLAQLRLNRQTKSQSASLCIPLDEFPLEIVEHVFSFISINPHIVPADLFNLILVDKRMYSAFSPKLYRTLTVNQWTAESLFCGIDHALVSNDGDVRHTRHSEGPANHTESAEGEESLVTSPMKKASETEPEAEAEAEVKQEPTYGAFGLDSLSIHKRRIGLLQHTKALIIEDWEGAKAIALGMGLLQEQADIDLAKLAEESEGSDYDHDGEDYYLIAYDRSPSLEGRMETASDPIFQQVRSVALGTGLERSTGFYPGADARGADSIRSPCHPYPLEQASSRTCLRRLSRC
ncbi:hypothetical protein IAU59_005443 [Kwoniella sp. CBS 9459]